VTTRVPYSAEHRPPAPVLAIRVSAPSGGVGVALSALIDTGADLSVIPKAVGDALGLPVTSSTRIQGVTGVAESVHVQAAVLEVAGGKHLTEVVCYGEDTILGRDILNGFVMKLDGPRTTLELTLVTAPPAKRRLRRVR
jgi:predicted aspartyl protease